jgi:hypothetical protein
VDNKENPGSQEKGTSNRDMRVVMLFISHYRIVLYSIEKHGVRYRMAEGPNRVEYYMLHDLIISTVNAPALEHQIYVLPI